MKTYIEVADAVYRIGDERLGRQKRRKKRIAVLAGVGCAVLIAAGIAIPRLIDPSPRIVQFMKDTPARQPDAGNYFFDPDDKRLMSGFADYILVAQVTETAGTTYEKSDTPYTVYHVRNLMNIKGSLTDDRLIETWEFGGVTRDNTKFVSLLPLLERNATYVLYLGCAENGRLYVQQAYALEMDADSDIEAALLRPEHPANALLRECIEAYENEDTTYAPKTKYVSPYDTAGTEDTP